MDTYSFGIIIIEDDVVDIEAMARGLRSLATFSPIVIFQTPREALDTLQQERTLFPTHVPCVILLSLRLPGMHGLELLERLRNNATLQRTPVFLLGEPYGEDKKAAEDLGAVCCFRKPSAPGDAEVIAARIELHMRGQDGEWEPAMRRQLYPRPYLAPPYIGTLPPL